ncbi:hypothetical protein FB451DRAFT_1416805 [Mycena latifolia]|nr:hypothetical protein FB451DRAFT_1416805 [Mycena latifolia]
MALVVVNSDLDSISLFSYMVGALLNAFTDPSASLSNQIHNLSTYAHFSFTMVKNIVFTVAKQQKLDPSVEVNAYNDGTDPVENHFGYTRELGGHNSAMNFKQGIERSGWACDIHAVHERNPGLHAGQRRRNVSRTEPKDHLNEHNFTGDLVSGHCDLGASWRSGRIETIRIFKEYSRLHPSAYDLPLHGHLDDPDRSLPSQLGSTSKVPETASASSAPNEMDVRSAPSATPVPSAHNSTQSDALMPAPADPDSVDDMLPDPNVPTISFEEVLQSEESEPAILKLEPRTGVRPDDYLLDATGKFVHKASICRLVLNKEFVAKSKNRGERAMGLAIKKVRAFTKPNGARMSNGVSITGSSFITGDLFITLIRDAKTVSLGVVRSTEISVDGTRTPDINVNSIKNDKANVKLTGQILKLKAVTGRLEDTTQESNLEQTSGDSGPPMPAKWTWLWLGHLVEPISPNAVDVHGRLSTEEMQQVNSTGATSALDDGLLRALIIQLWKRVEDSSMGLREIPFLKEALAGFPYAWSTGLPALLSEGGTAFITAKSASDPCLYSPEIPSNWRGHMGAHIIRKIRKAGEIERDRKDKTAGTTTVYPQFHFAAD